MTSESIGERLHRLGIVLPSPPVPKGAYVPVVTHGKYAWVSGMLPLSDGKLMAVGAVDTEVTVAQARASARLSALNALSALHNSLGNLEILERIVRVGVYVASSPSFFAQPDVANGASDLFIEVFQDAGRHARAAVGVQSLPLNSPVEVEILVALR